MAHFSIIPSIISSLVLLFLLFAAPSSASKVVDVEAICAQAPDPKFCSSVLNSKLGGAKGADILSHAQYTINVHRVKATNTNNLVSVLIANSGNNPKAKAHSNTLPFIFMHVL
ncbi:putative pectinesterase inhibitor domain-containing protein [Lupinus albus]|uniref:Putative pectinesterase inhibitor domain-containing protein n=1 Tax=Lupinus albus TaxID=3870 RepID=A0A6A4PBS9_LUPAL|nr:putative pectinesterase inhibitor domain-containing protein [Lupinus albus]